MTDFNGALDRFLAASVEHHYADQEQEGPTECPECGWKLQPGKPCDCWREE